MMQFYNSFCFRKHYSIKNARFSHLVDSISIEMGTFVFNYETKQFDMLDKVLDITSARTTNSQYLK